MADPYTLSLVQNQPKRVGFRYRVNGVPRDLSLYQWASQARQKEAITGALIVDLAPHLALDPDDSTILRLDLPASITAGISKVRDEAHWDLFIWPTSAPKQVILLVEGPVTLDPASTVLP